MNEFLIVLLSLVGIGGFAAQNSAPPVSQSPHDNHDLYTLARTIWGEARSEGYQGMVAVANVIMNRYAQARDSIGKARQFGSTVADICQKPYQFSAWNANDPNLNRMLNVTQSNQQFAQALSIAAKALAGNLPDITNGADHYHTGGVSPSWSRGRQTVAKIGSHKFFYLA